MKKIILLTLSVAMALTVLPVMQAFAFSRGDDPPPGGGGGGKPPVGEPGGRGGEDNSILSTVWATEPEKTQLDAGQSATFTLTVTNKSKNSEAVEISTKDTGLTLAPKSFTLAAGAKTDISVTVVMPVQNDKPEANFSINFTSVDVKNKTVMLRIRYKTPTNGQKANQQIETVWETQPEKTQLDAGQSATFNLKVTNKTDASKAITLSTKNTGLTITPISFTLVAGASTTVAVAVIMPAQDNKREAEFAINFACDGVTGKSVKFRIMYKTQVKPPEPAKEIVTSWTADPAKTTLLAGQTGTFTLNLANKSTAEQTATLTTKSTGLTMTPAKSTIAVGKTAAIAVKVVMPTQGKNTQAEFVIQIANAAGKTFTVKFVIKYKATTCVFASAWVTNPNNASLAQGAKGTYGLKITNTSNVSTTFKLTAGKNMTLSSKTFALAAGKAATVTITATMPTKAAKATKADFSFVVGSTCGKSSTIKFSIKYK